MIVALLVDLANDQVSYLQKKHIVANLHRPFYHGESSHPSMKDFSKERCSLPLRFSTLFNQESFTECKFA